MPKRSREEDRKKLMWGTTSTKRVDPEKKKSCDTVPKQAPKATASKGLNIPLNDVTPEFRKLVLEELVRSGKARIIRAKRKDIVKNK